MKTTTSNEISPRLVRAIAFIAMGLALVTGWLRPLYEKWIARGAVSVPEWWEILYVASLGALLFVCLRLRKQDQRLYNAAWAAFVLSLLANVMPGFP